MRKIGQFSTFITFALLGAGALTAQAADIERVAVGVHPTFTRVVLHLDEVTAFTQERDANGNPSLVLSSVALAGPAQEFSARHEPILSLSYEPNEAGTRVSFATATTTKVKSFALTPDEYGGHRVVIDFTKADEAPSLTNSVREPITKPDPPAVIPTIAAAPRTDLTPEPKPTLESPTATVKLQDDPCRQTQIMLNQNQWNMAALIDHGLCKKEAGRLEEAQSILERILTFDPEFHRARLALAEVYETRGYSSKAREEYSYVLETNPPTDVRTTIEQRLTQLQ